MTDDRRVRADPLGLKTGFHVGSPGSGWSYSSGPEMLPSRRSVLRATSKMYDLRDSRFDDFFDTFGSKEKVVAVYAGDTIVWVALVGMI